MNIDLLRYYLSYLYNKLDNSRPDMGEIEQGLLSNLIDISDSMSSILYKCENENELVIDYDYINVLINKMLESEAISMDDARRIEDGRPDSINDIIEKATTYIDRDIEDAVLELLEFYDEGMGDDE